MLVLVLRDIDQHLRRFQRFGHGLRGEDGQHAVHIFVVQAGGDGMVVTVRLRVADDVHGVAVRPVRRQVLIEIFDSGIRQSGHDQSQIGGAVSRHHGGAAAVGNDGKPVSGRAETAGQGSGRGEQFGDVLHAYHTDAPDSGVEHIIRSHQRGGMRHRGF